MDYGLPIEPSSCDESGDADYEASSDESSEEDADCASDVTWSEISGLRYNEPATEWRCSVAADRQVFFKIAQQYYMEASEMSHRSMEELADHRELQLHQIPAARHAVDSVRALFLKAADLQHASNEVLGQDHGYQDYIDHLRTMYFRMYLLMELHCKQVEYLTAVLETQQIKQCMEAYMLWWLEHSCFIN